MRTTRVLFAYNILIFEMGPEFYIFLSLFITSRRATFILIFQWGRFSWGQGGGGTLVLFSVLMMGNPHSRRDAERYRVELTLVHPQKPQQKYHRNQSKTFPKCQKWVSPSLETYFIFFDEYSKRAPQGVYQGASMSYKHLALTPISAIVRTHRYPYPYPNTLANASQGRLNNVTITQRDPYEGATRLL